MHTWLPWKRTISSPEEGWQRRQRRQLEQRLVGLEGVEQRSYLAVATATVAVEA